MAVPKHKLEGQKSIFIRYRHGFRLYIQPDIKEKISDLLPKLKSDLDDNKVFRTVIEDIKDGSGYSIHPHSTWYSAIEEIFESYRRFDSLDANTKKLLLELLEILTKNESIENSWDKSLKPFILKNIEVLSRWVMVKQRRDFFFGEIKRDKNGEYYVLENGQKVQVLGTKTKQEECFEYITDDVTRQFGLLGQILHFIALIDIAYQYKMYPTHFSDRVVCLLPDNEHSSAYLHWVWRILGTYDYIPAFWKPRSCFSDPQWLAYDLLANFAELHQLQEELTPQVVGTDTIQQYQEAFKGFPLQYNLALETNLFLGDDPEVYFDFEGRKIRWINGTKFVYPILVVPSNKEDYSDAIEISRKFLSLLVRETQTPIVEIFSAGAPARINPIVKQPRTIGGLGLDPRYLLLDDTSKFSNKKWIGLAFYKEGINSNSIYYSFLCFYKVIELAFSRDNNKVMDWIDKNIDKVVNHSAPNWKQEVLKKGQKASTHLYGSDRCAIAHVGNEKGKVTNPDNPEDYKRIHADLPIIRELATEVFRQNLL